MNTNTQNSDGRVDSLFANDVRFAHALGAHDQAGRQFGWSRDVELHVFSKITLHLIMDPNNSQKHTT